MFAVSSSGAFMCNHTGGKKKKDFPNRSLVMNATDQREVGCGNLKNIHKYSLQAAVLNFIISIFSDIAQFLLIGCFGPDRNIFVNEWTMINFFTVVSLYYLCL